jgi:hypothetical protein
MFPLNLAADTQFPDERSITLDIFLAEVSQHTLTSANHHHKSTAGVKILLMLAQMLCQLVDARGQQRNLYFRRTCVALFGGVAGDNVGFDLFLKRHCRVLLLSTGTPQFSID